MTNFTKLEKVANKRNLLANKYNFNKTDSNFQLYKEVNKEFNKLKRTFFKEVNSLVGHLKTHDTHDESNFYFYFNDQQIHYKSEARNILKQCRFIKLKK